MPATPQESAARRYRIEKYLTEGGMGAIYIGKKLGPGGFAKEVVLKQLLPEYTSRPEFRDLFFREAKISATLDHANIVHTFDLVESDQSLFIVMEYVRGADLRTIIRRARHRKRELSPAAAIHIALEILSGLGYAHTRRDSTGKSLDIIHRDVSPSNIICSAQGAAKLSDFGIAKASTYSSVFYRVRGKVGYMSPEQARSQPIDHRCDLFSLSVCLYESLSGERLFVGDLNTPADEIYGIHILPVSRKRPGLPPALDEVLTRALAPNVDDRYQSAAELAEALRTVAHRTGLAFSAPELAAHLHDILGDNPERWLRDEPVAVTDPVAVPAGGSELVGREAASLGIVSDIADDEPGQSVLSPKGVSGSKDFDLDSMLNDEATRPGADVDAGRPERRAEERKARSRSTDNPDGSVESGTPPPVWTRDSRPFQAAPAGPPAGVAERRAPQPSGSSASAHVGGAVRAGAAPVNLPGVPPAPPVPPTARTARPLPRATIRNAAVPPPFFPTARGAGAPAPPPPPPPFPRAAPSAPDDIEDPTPRPPSGIGAAFLPGSQSGSPGGPGGSSAVPQPSSFDIEDPSTPAPPSSRPAGGPPAGYRGSPPAGYPAPAFEPAVPAAQLPNAYSSGPNALQLKQPETIDFHEGGAAYLPEKGSGPPRWLAALLIVGSLAGGAVLADRITRAQLARALAPVALAQTDPPVDSTADPAEGATPGSAAPTKPAPRVEAPGLEADSPATGVSSTQDKGQDVRQEQGQPPPPPPAPPTQAAAAAGVNRTAAGSARSKRATKPGKVAVKQRASKSSAKRRAK